MLLRDISLNFPLVDKVSKDAFGFIRIDVLDFHHPKNEFVFEIKLRSKYEYFFKEKLFNDAFKIRLPSKAISGWFSVHI